MYRIFVNDDSVPDAEFDDVRQLLNEHSINFTERPRLIGSLFRFGSTGPGCDLLVHTESDQIRARELIGDYQQQLIDRSRAEYEARKPRQRTREVVGWAIAALVIFGVLALSIGIGL